MAITISKEELLGINDIENVNEETTTSSLENVNSSLDGIIALLDKINMLLENKLVQAFIENFLKNKFGIEIQTAQTHNSNSLNLNYKEILNNIKQIAGDKTINELLRKYGDMKIKEIIGVVENVIG